MTEITARFSVSKDHACLAGHFPGRPLVPGVVVLENVFAAIQDTWREPLALEGISSCKFLRAVLPEDEILVSVRLSPEPDSELLRARFAASCSGAPVAEGTFLIRTGSRE